MLFNEIFFVCIFVLVLFPSISFSQDKIYKTDNTIIQAKVQEVNDADIKYRKFTNPNGPLYSIKKDFVRMIIYENGEKEVYNPEHKQQVVSKPAEERRPDIHNSDDEINNTDIVITTDGQKIFCTIDKTDRSGISYHIRRRGADPRGYLGLDDAVKYFYNEQWYYGTGVSSEQANARNFILSEKVNDAIASYSRLLEQDSTNVTLLAEDAYALALGGIYDGALMRLDYSWSLGTNTPDVNYFTAQVFSLMGYDELAAGFWKPSGKYKAPAWIASKSASLLEKFRCKHTAGYKVSREELIYNFQRANELAAHHLFLQSIGLFHKTIDLCPDQYILYVGYSTALEQAGAIEESVKAIGKAISLLENKPADLDKKQVLEQRQMVLDRKLASVKEDEVPGLSQNNNLDVNRPSMMAYGGFMLAPEVVNLNFRIGYFVSGSTNAAFDVGISQNSAVTSVNLGLSGYYRKNVLVCGGGLILNAGNSGTNLFVKISLGISIRDRKQKSSFDIFIDGYSGLAKNSLTTLGMSIGKSLYFGKRR